MTGPDLPEMTRPRPDACPSDLLLERRLAGELASAHAAALDAHAASCPACGARVRAMQEPVLEDSKDRLLAQAALVVPESRSSLWKRIGIVRPALLATMLAATVVLVVLPRLRERTPVAPPAVPGDGLHSVLTKGGGDSISVFVQRHGAIRRLGEDEALAPGDRVQYALVVEQASLGALYGRDSRGATRYVPVEGDAPVVLPGGRETLLQPAYVLDATPGDELLIAVLCPEPFLADYPLERLQQWSGDMASLLPSPDCAAVVRVLRKVAVSPGGDFP